MSVRGGYREGSGAKPTWKHGKTKAVRVPEVLADQVLEYARKLDEGIIVERVTESKVINLAGISLKTHGGKIVVQLEDLAKAGYQIMPESLGIVFKSILRKTLEN
jgi:hypothetical protein